MIYSVSGILRAKGDNFAVVEAGGIGLKIHMTGRTLAALARLGAPVSLFSSLYPREDAMELYGFLSEAELAFFEQLVSVSGVGPKSALAVLEIGDLSELAAAIKEGRPDLLTRASGIGRKTAERIVVELKRSMRVPDAGDTVKRMESDADIVEALAGLGYRRDEARAALERISKETGGLEERLKAALKALGGKR